MRLLDFWCLQRQQNGEQTILRDFHHIIANALENILVGAYDKPNLMILMPPRCGKTDLSIKGFIPYALSWYPDSEFITCSFSDSLAVDNTSHVRDTLTSEWYQSLIDDEFGCRVPMKGKNPDGRMDYFKTVEGGSVKGVGVGSGITGFGAGKLREEFGGAIIIDDPTKAQDSDSPTVKQTCIKWFHQTLESRRNRKKMPMTPIILVMQRLASDDLAGHLLKTQRERWNVIEIPAHNEDEISIWPDRISMEELGYMREMDPDTYHAQFMQKPNDSLYAILKNEYWMYYKDPREVEKRLTFKIITADTAFKEKDSADFSVFQCWGFESTKGAYLLDQIRGRWEFPELVAMGKEFFRRHASRTPGQVPVREAWVEDRASGTSLIQTLQRAGLPFREWLPKHADQKVIKEKNRLASTDKVARAKQISMLMYARRIFLPCPKATGKRWVNLFTQETSSFSADNSHAFDDQVDAMTTALLMWQQRGGGTGPLPKWDRGMVRAGDEK
jgi:predicted phage terminase large subunit-like protein